MSNNSTTRVDDLGQQLDELQKLVEGQKGMNGGEARSNSRRFDGRLDALQQELLSVRRRLKEEALESHGFDRRLVDVFAGEDLDTFRENVRLAKELIYGDST